jgi:hypothetical protein
VMATKPRKQLPIGMISAYCKNWNINSSHF